VSIGARARRSRPLVVTISELPIFYEAVAGTLGDRATVQALRPVGRDTEVVLRAIDPDAVIVDNAQDAQAAVESALEQGFPIVHISSQDSVLRVLGPSGSWSEWGMSPMGSEALWNILRSTTLGAA
jgi:hypothetical protein